MQRVALVVWLAACGGAPPPAAAQPLSNHTDAPPPAPPPDPQKVELAMREAQSFAFESYPQWAAQNPSQQCPRNFNDLLGFTRLPNRDPWGHPFVFYCGARVPAGFRGIIVVSPGPDGQLGTSDDVKSTGDGAAM